MPIEQRPINVFLDPEAAARAQTLDDFWTLVVAEAERLQLSEYIAVRHPDHLIPQLEALVEGIKIDSTEGVSSAGLLTVAIAAPAIMRTAQATPPHSRSRRSLFKRVTQLAAAIGAGGVLGRLYPKMTSAIQAPYCPCVQYAGCKEVSSTCGGYKPCYYFYQVNATNYCTWYCSMACYCDEYCA